MARGDTRTSSSVDCATEDVRCTRQERVEDDAADLATPVPFTDVGSEGVHEQKSSDEQ